jgi:hypothetical protein
VFDEYHARIVDSTHHAVYGEPHPSARTLRTSNRLPRSPARANVEDVGREILARKLVSRNIGCIKISISAQDVFGICG